MVDERSRDRVQSIERGVAVLRAFGGSDAALSATEIASRVDLPRPVVRRILLTYEHLGYVRSGNGMWALTPRILELAAGYFATGSLPEAAYPLMDEVVERTGETCSVGVLDGADVIHVARVEDHRPMPHAVRVGTRLPAHATAIGKVLLADLSDDELDAYLSKAKLDAHTPHTLTKVAELRERIAKVRQDRYDVSIEELHPGMVAVAVPIVVDGRAVGGLTVSSSTVRESPETLENVIAPILGDAASRIATTYRAANPQLHRARLR